MRVCTSMEDEYSYCLHMQGMASTLPEEPLSDGDAAVRALHDVVAEVTGKPVPQAPKPRMGFL